MLRTARLLLRPARESDLNAFHAMFSDPETMRYWDRPAWNDIERTRAFLDGMMHADPVSREEYVLEFEGQCIGKAGCWKPVEMGFLIDRAYWGKGFASEALAALIPRCFIKFAEAKALTAECDPRNIRSRNLLERHGFLLDRIGEKDFLYGQEWVDTAYYTLPRPPDEAMR